mmetsp:Transcript_49219/g.73195  ORF Transcript_49219/g.73195 Transcript_49219/m.73195 type:complete len:161 (-) Transcript_49219:230-712(-)
MNLLSVIFSFLIIGSATEAKRHSLRKAQQCLGNGSKLQFIGTTTYCDSNECCSDFCYCDDSGGIWNCSCQEPACIQNGQPLTFDQQKGQCDPNECCSDFCFCNANNQCTCQHAQCKDNNWGLEWLGAPRYCAADVCCSDHCNCWQNAEGTWNCRCADKPS